jgi:membrane protease YdiL (CAAX protease family)
MSYFSPIVNAFRGPQFKPTVILLLSSPLLLVWKYFFDADFFAGPFAADTDTSRVVGAIYHFLGGFVLMGVLPALVVKLLFRERLADYGVGLGVPGRTLRTFFIWGPIFVLVAYLSSADAALRSKYPINPQAGASAAMFALHAVTYLLYYLGWEFYFRGFLLQGLRGAIGDANAVLVQVLGSALLHIGSPASETFGAVLGGLLWGALAIRTRSILSGLGQHYLLGIALDAFICFG